MKKIGLLFLATVLRLMVCLSINAAQPSRESPLQKADKPLHWDEKLGVRVR